MSKPPPRDWDKELAEIDKLIAKTPARAPQASGPPAKAAPGAQPARSGGQAAPGPAPARAMGSVGGTWLKVGLGVALGAGMTQWPYPNTCGLGLFIYLGALGMVVVAGGWAARATWRRRIGLAHIIATGVVFWGLALLSRELLPRMGYASEVLPWVCR